MSRTSQIIGMSEDLKDALGEYANAHDLSIADCARQAIAQFIDYDLASEEKEASGSRGRPRVYESKEARRAAARERSKEKRVLTRQLLEAHREQARADEIARMEASLAKSAKAKKQ